MYLCNVYQGMNVAIKHQIHCAALIVPFSILCADFSAVILGLFVMQFMTITCETASRFIHDLFMRGIPPGSLLPLVPLILKRM